jgi:hypothetical protein
MEYAGLDQPLPDPPIVEPVLEVIAKYRFEIHSKLLQI